jgi:hypothetical protein
MGAAGVKVLTASLLALWLTTSVYSYDPPYRTPEEMDAAVRYEFDGVSFSLSLSQFRQRFPRAEKVDKATDEQIGLLHYKLETDKATVIAVSFYNGKVHKIHVVYFADKLKAIGGEWVVMDDLAKRFGKPNPDSKGVISKDPLRYEGTWTFMKEGMGRCLEAERTEKYLMVTMTDLATSAEVLKKKGYIK